MRSTAAAQAAALATAPARLRFRQVPQRTRAASVDQIASPPPHRHRAFLQKATTLPREGECEKSGAGARRFRSPIARRIAVPPSGNDRNPSCRNRRLGLLDWLRMSGIVDRDVGKIAVGDQDRTRLLAAQYPSLEMDGDRGPAGPHQI